jgi:hypothetical protein
MSTAQPKLPDCIRALTKATDHYHFKGHNNAGVWEFMDTHGVVRLGSTIRVTVRVEKGMTLSNGSGYIAYGEEDHSIAYSSIEEATNDIAQYSIEKAAWRDRMQQIEIMKALPDHIGVKMEGMHT